MTIYDHIIDCIETGKKGVLATVIRRIGSSPRDVGAKMFIREDGKSFGTVGGGRLESDTFIQALNTMGSPQTSVYRVTMNGTKVEGEDMLCGGNVEVLLEPVTAGHLDVFRKVRDALKDRAHGVVVTTFHPSPHEKSFLAEGMVVSGHPLDDERVQWAKTVLADGVFSLRDGVLAEPLHGSTPLYLFGAGHVARFVAKLGTMVDFDVTVVDDRVEFANAERFPDAGSILVAGVPDAFDRITFTGDEYVVIVTRSHDLDARVLAAAMKKPTKYIGMIGSTRKVKVILDHIRGQGFSEESVATIHTPIGMSIGAETPQEIALAIVAELVAVRSGTIS